FKLLVDILQTFDGTTNDFFTETNPAQWLRTGEKYQVDSTDTDGLGISLMDHFVSLPSSFEMSAEIMALSGVDRWFDGFLIFDYQSETDFKYAGYFAGQNQWVIGHFQGNFNNRLSQIDWDDVGRSINLDTPYMLHLSIDGSVVKLSVDGEVITSTTFATPITSPKIGLANKNGVTQFDNFTAGMTAPKQQSILPYVNDFETGDTSELNFVGSHRWSVRNQNGGQKLVFNGANQYGLGVAYLNVEGLMPSKYEIVAKVAAHDGSNVWHDGFLIFDYQGPNDFKYAGMFVGQNEWVIGHYQGNWGNRLAVYDLDALGLSLNAHQEYTLLVEIDELDVDLYVNGIRRLSATFEDGIYQGPAGVAGYNSYTSFDNLEIGSRVSYGHPVSGNYYEDFDDNKADYFQYKDPQNWAVVAGAGKTVLRTNTSSNDQLSVAYVPLDLASAKSGFSIEVDILSHDVSSGWRDGFIIFDYKNENDFKYAGMFVGQNELTIGHYQGDWTNRLRSTTGEAFRRPLQTERWYRMEVRISGDIAELRINGYYMIDVRFDEPIYNGSVGLAADKAFTWFDNFKLTTLPSAAPTDSLFASWKEEEDELLI
ncbi:MAG: hypothetical protein KDA65_05615, partial [Planctomycetaceae bacterium]|nr:hypothetical protein [Planctomycetaceae bacterium]